MDETQIQASKLSSEMPVFIPPHRRRHLKSETYRTLLRIFSQCYDDLNTEDGSPEMWQRTEEPASQPVELAPEKVPELNWNGDDKGSEDGRLSEQMTIDRIEQFMGIEENEELLNQKNAKLGSHPELMLIDELEHIVQGNEDVGLEINSKPLTDPMLQSQSGVNDSSNKNRKHVASQQIDLSGNVSQMLLCSDSVATGGSAVPRDNVDGGCLLLNIDLAKKQETTEPNSVSECNNSIISTFEDFEEAENNAQLVSEEIIESGEKNTVADISNSCNKDDDQRSPRTNALKREHEITLKDDDLENPVCDGGMMDSGNHAMEEGEISGGCSMDDISMDMLLRDAGMQSKKLNDEHITGCITGRSELFCNEAKDGDSVNSFFYVDTVDKTNNLAGLWGSERNKAVRIPDAVLHEKTLVGANDPILEDQKIKKGDKDGNISPSLYRNILEEDAAKHNKTSTEKDVEVCRTKKRGPRSKEKRAKRKAKDRKKRSEKNRQLGVRRLKLHSISKPKPIQYCRHYLHGRCQEGDNCKFSHDIVPLTKSKPCCHFARHSCMKGDDCPFDHQLSKYPCSNFVSKGFCSRGDDCMFSHKILSEENSATVSNAVEPEKKIASLIGDATAKKQQSNSCAASHYTSSVSSLYTKMHSHKNTEKNLNGTVFKQSELGAKGTSFLSVGNSPLVDKLKQNPFRNGITDFKDGNHINQHGSGTAQNSNDVLNRTTPVVRPKGINFLSFGSVQRDASSGCKLASTYSSGDNGVNLSVVGSSNTPNQSSFASFSDSTVKGIQFAVAPKGINFLSFGNASNKMPNRTISSSFSDSMPKDLTVPNGVNFLSCGKISIDDSFGKGKAKLMPDGIGGIDGFVKVQQNAPDEPHKSCSISLNLTSAPISFIQSSGNSPSKIYTDTPHSAQKALFSTLSFAAKYESRMKSNQSFHASVVGKEI